MVKVVTYLSKQAGPLSLFLCLSRSNRSRTSGASELIKKRLTGGVKPAAFTLAALARFECTTIHAFARDDNRGLCNGYVRAMLGFRDPITLT